MSQNQINNTLQQINPVPQNNSQIKVVVEQRIKFTPVGVTVKLDCNPIARYNHGIQSFNTPCNQIQGIELIQVWCPWILSWVYDLVIYFYTMFFNTITCQNANQRGLLITLILLAIYVVILIMPIISVITFCISAIFFLYYVAGIIVYCNNLSRLGSHQFTEKMVEASKAPPFQGFVNQFFQVTNEQTIHYYQSKNMWEFYQKIVQTHQGKFMAYTPQYLERNYYYIRSGKMIAFHISFMLLAIIGLIISVNAFPSAYGKK